MGKWDIFFFLDAIFGHLKYNPTQPFHFLLGPSKNEQMCFFSF